MRHFVCTVSITGLEGNFIDLIKKALIHFPFSFLPIKDIINMFVMCIVSINFSMVFCRYLLTAPVHNFLEEDGYRIYLIWQKFRTLCDTTRLVQKMDMVTLTAIFGSFNSQFYLFYRLWIGDSARRAQWMITFIFKIFWWSNAQAKVIIGGIWYRTISSKLVSKLKCCYFY